MIYFTDEHCDQSIIYQIPLASGSKRYKVYVQGELLGTTAGRRNESILIDSAEFGHLVFNVVEFEKHLRSSIDIMAFARLGKRL
jgi:hypothetical protein